MEDNTDFAQVVRDIRQIKTGIWLVLILGLTALAGQIFLLVKLPAILQLQTAGTEPPIRVRGGSMHLELLGGGAWNSNSGATEDTDWNLGLANRPNDDIHLQIKGANNTADCPILATRKKVVFTYQSDDGSVTNDVTIHATGNRTKVTARTKIKKDPDGNLAYDLEHHGYISGLKATGGGPAISCTFGPDDLSDVILSPW